MTIWEARSEAVKQLQYSQSNSKEGVIFLTPALDADCILAYVLDCSRSEVLSKNQDFLDSDDEEKFFSLIAKRATGLPVAYIIEKREFFGLDFFVTTDVLIPKADTELLVEKALEIVSTHFSRTNASFVFADVCTGSGCVALSILRTIFDSYKDIKALPLLTAYCTDISRGALDVAYKNALSLLPLDEQDGIRFFQGDLLDPLKEASFDLIVSNPPYVPKDIVDELLKDGRSEPRIALDGDIGSGESNDGLWIIKRLIPQAFGKLKSGGSFLVETGEYNAKEASLLMESCGFLEVETFDDLSGQPRVTIGRKP